MRTLYHEFESLDHLLSTRLLPGGEQEPVQVVVFGGTGAVGGAVVLELCRLSLRSQRYRQRPIGTRIYATGSSEKEIATFVRRLYMALEPEVEIEKVEPCRHYRLGGEIEVYFSVLSLELPSDLRQTVASARGVAAESFDLEETLEHYFEERRRPFLEFVESIGASLLHAVVVAIPLPSVATYALDIIDQLVAEHGLDHHAQQRIKSHYLRTFIRGLAVIQQRHARCVVLAHTTAVGGMYRVDGGQPEIRLGFAHSALGKKLVEKKFFADQLTQLYLDHGFDVMITAAAIGIDGVEFHRQLPLDRAVHGKLSALVDGRDPAPVEPEDLGDRILRLYPALPAALEAGGEDRPELEDRPLLFGKGKELVVSAAIRSGENGMFSVANCMALYNVMKVAIPEELAAVLVRHAVFGPERRRDWFEDKICYYAETENARFALRLLESHPKLIEVHLGAFYLQSFQALGSATHQARLHELGLLIILLRLLDLGPSFESIPEKELEEALTDFEGFFWRRTRLPSFEAVEEISAPRLGELFGRLCEVRDMQAAGHFLGFDARRQGSRLPGRERFLARLATQIQRYLSAITSVGTPILYRHPETGRDHLLTGPYAAPLDRVVSGSGDIVSTWHQMAQEHGLQASAIRDWTVVNNGFLDLRPHALASAAMAPGPQLARQLCQAEREEGLAAWLEALPVGSYFTTCGTVALKLRLSRLFARLQQRRVELGTHETWKHLFQQDADQRHILAPGLVETVRMYTEGLGKVTGTGVLWPEWGY